VRRALITTRRAADMRVGLDVQGCLQYSTERGVLCSGDQDWMASTVVGPGLFLPRYRRLRTRGVRGSAPLRGRGCLSGMRFRSVIARRNVLPAGQSLPCLGERVAVNYLTPGMTHRAVPRRSSRTGAGLPARWVGTPGRLGDERDWRRMFTS